LIFILHGKGLEFEVFINVGSADPQEIVNFQLYYILKYAGSCPFNFKINKEKQATNLLVVNLEKRFEGKSVPFLPLALEQSATNYFHCFYYNENNIEVCLV
jgi:hypothetical protein